MRIQSLMSILLILSVLFIFSYCGTHKSKESNIKIQISIIGRLNPDKFKELGGTFDSAYINIINNTDSVFSFWTMSCSWMYNWISDTNNINLFLEGCDANYPVFKKIESNQKLIYKAIIWVRDSSEVINGHSYKLGLIQIKEKEISRQRFYDFGTVLNKKIKERKDIIWSEPFKITK